VTQLTQTRDQWINNVARRLKIIGTGQPLDDEYRKIIDDNIDPLIQQLSVDQICEIANDQEIPSEWFEALTCLLANIVSPHLVGVPFSADAKLIYEMQLKRLTANRPTYETLPIEFF